MKNCSIEHCTEHVYNKDEQLKKFPFCYAHAKMRDGLFDAPKNYTFAENEFVLCRAVSNPSNYNPISGDYWNIHGAKELNKFSIEDVYTAVSLALRSKKTKLNLYIASRLKVLRAMSDNYDTSIEDLINTLVVRIINHRFKDGSSIEDRYVEGKSVNYYIATMVARLLSDDVRKANTNSKHLKSFESLLDSEITNLESDEEEEDQLSFIENQIPDREENRPDKVLEFKQLLEIVEREADPYQFGLLTGEYETSLEAAEAQGISYVLFRQRFRRFRMNLIKVLEESGYDRSDLSILDVE